MTECRAPGCDDPATEQYHDGKGNSLDVCGHHYTKLFMLDLVGPYLDRTVTHETASEETQTGLFGGLFQ